MDGLNTLAILPEGAQVKRFVTHEGIVWAHAIYPNNPEKQDTWLNISELMEETLKHDGGPL